MAVTLSVEDLYMRSRLTSAQLAIWLGQKLYPDAPVLDAAALYYLPPGARIDCFQAAFQTLIDTTDVFRMVVIEEDGIPQPHIVEPFPCTMDIIDVSDAPEPTDAANAWAREQVSQIVDRVRPMFRAKLIKLTWDSYAWFFHVNHLITDAYSGVLTVQRLNNLYRLAVDGKLEPRPTFPQYSNYAAEEYETRIKKPPSEELAFWRKKLARRLEAPMFYGQTRVSSKTVLTTHNQWLGQELTQKLLGIHNDARVAGKKPEATLFNLFAAALYALMYRISGSRELAIGTMYHNRRTDAARNTIGAYVGALPLRVYIDDGETFLSLAQKVRAEAIENRKNANGVFRVSLDYGDYDVMLNVHIVHPVGLLGHEESLPEWVRSGHGRETLVIHAFFVPQRKDYWVFFDVNDSVFDDCYRARIVRHFIKMLCALADNLEREIDDVDLLGGEERNRLLIEFNQTALPFPDTTTAHALVEEQARNTPEAPAIVFGDRVLTYGELEARANQLARHLHRLGVGHESLVGICLLRSPEMVIAALGVMKAGGAYVPIDPTQPDDRLSFMLKDSRIQVLLTQSALADRLRDCGATIVLLDADWPAIARQTAKAFPSPAGPDSLAYAIYTSGSTGWPKGVLIEHRGLCNLMQMQATYFPVTASSRVLQFASFSFDASVSEIFVTLGAGATLCIPPEEIVFDPWSLSAFMEEYSVSVATLPPALLRLMETKDVPSLQTVVSAGERCPRDVVERWAPGRRFANGYGPTEATVCSAMAVCEPGVGEAPPIGRAVDNVHLLVLDKKLRLVPIGTPGELHIGGVGVARGYLDQPELTAERFIPHPFSDSPGARLYKTGDLVRQHPDGVLEFIGRIDRQVKLHGYRIEPAEIESVLESHPAVISAAVEVRGDVYEEDRLVAYVVANGTQCPTVSELRSHIGRRLPRYMVPAIYTFLDDLPLTPSGKVDRAQLPSPSLQRTEPEAEADLPQSDIERRLVAIWAEVLHLDTVGIHDNFFEKGGDSIASIQVAGAARAAGLSVSPNLLFEHSTVASLAAAISHGVSITVAQDRVTGPVPLTPIQHWYFDIGNPNPSHWNQSIILRLHGPIDIEILEHAVSAVLNHHDMLRARYRRENGSWVQWIVERGGIAPVELVDLSDVPHDRLEEAKSAAEARIQTSLDIERGPVLRVGIIRRGRDLPDSAIVVAHHLVVDAVSWRFLLEDLERAYDHAQRGIPITFLPKTTSYKHWSSRLHELASDNRLAEDAHFWHGHLGDPSSCIPTDFAEGNNTSGSSETVHVTLDAERAAPLLEKFSESSGTQLLDALITGLAESFCEWTGKDTFTFNLETHGREHSFADVDLSRTIGWFTSLIPVRIDLHSDCTASKRVIEVAARLRTARRHGLGYGLMRYLTSEQATDRELLPSFADVTFNYMGALDRLAPPGRFFKTGSLFSSFRGNYCPESQRPCRVEINGFTDGGALHFLWTYSRNLYQRDTVEHVAAAYIEHLENLAKKAEPAPEITKTSAETFEFTEMGTLIPIKPSGSRPPFFCVPGGGGVVFPFYNLIPYLEAEQPLYGLQDPSLDERVTPFKHVEDLAAFYLDQMREVQPGGPYYLGGWSFGGVVAYEIAQQALGAGESVGLLAIMDQLAPPLIAVNGGLRQRLRKLWPALVVLSRTVRGSFPYVRDGLYLVFSYNQRNGPGKGTRLSLRDYFTWAWRDALFKSFLRHATISQVTGDHSNLMKFKQPAARRTLYILRCNVRALKRYDARPYPGVVDVFRSADDWNDLNMDEAEDLGWGAFAEGGVQVHRLKGSHVSLMRKPQIEEFAQKLNIRLHETQYDSTETPSGYQADVRRT